MTGLYNKKGNTVISSYEYTYYVSGNRKSETDADGNVTSYTYDDMNRIVTESDGDDTITYTYDGRGNRTKRTVTGLDAGTTVYTYDSNNRLTYESTSTPMMGVSLTAYEYDKNGNNTAKVCGTERLEYRYDAFGKLKRYITNDDIARYAYNSSGIRTLKSVDGDTTKYILNGGDVVGEVSGGETTTYLRGINLICTDEYYYVFDAHGDVVNLTDDDGSVVKSYVYDAFGVEKNADDNDSNPFRYCGEYWDSETETYYLRARNYDPSLGRFTSEDTYWNVSNMIYGDYGNNGVPSISTIIQSNNLYIYAINNPLRYSDTTGNNIGDILYGLAEALDENNFGGLIGLLTRKIVGKGDRDLDSEYDYYMGRVIGDVLSALHGAYVSAAGIAEIIASITAGGAITVGSGGTLTVAGVAISLEGVAAGAVAVTYGGAVVTMSLDNFYDDVSEMQREGRRVRDSKKDLKKIDQKYLEDNGIKIHDFKNKVLKKANVKDKVISHYNIMRDPKTKELFLVPNGNRPAIPTGRILD